MLNKKSPKPTEVANQILNVLRNLFLVNTALLSEHGLENSKYRALNIT